MDDKRMRAVEDQVLELDQSVRELRHEIAQAVAARVGDTLEQHLRTLGQSQADVLQALRDQGPTIAKAIADGMAKLKLPSQAAPQVRVDVPPQPAPQVQVSVPPIAAPNSWEFDFRFNDFGELVGATASRGGEVRH